MNSDLRIDVKYVVSSPIYGIVIWSCGAVALRVCLAGGRMTSIGTEAAGGDLKGAGANGVAPENGDSKSAGRPDAASPAEGHAPTELTGYVLAGHQVQIRPAPLERPWMEATPQRYAYRCLPLNIANCHGWEMLCATTFSAIWDGGAAIGSITVDSNGGEGVAISHFGSGVLTFHVPALFRTDPGYDLMVSGPVNRPKDGIAPLTGVIETDWAPYTFTMNWLFTRPHHRVTFEAGEPMCHFFPVRRDALDNVSPRLVSITDDDELHAAYQRWAAGRDAFNRGLHGGAPDVVQQGWQKAYFRGLMPDGAAGAADHRNKLRLRPFRDDVADSHPTLRVDTGEG